MMDTRRSRARQIYGGRRSVYPPARRRGLPLRFADSDRNVGGLAASVLARNSTCKCAPRSKIFVQFWAEMCALLKSNTEGQF